MFSDENGVSVLSPSNNKEFRIWRSQIQSRWPDKVVSKDFKGRRSRSWNGQAHCGWDMAGISSVLLMIITDHINYIHVCTTEMLQSIDLENTV